jgi:hypothetical protein
MGTTDRTEPRNRHERRKPAAHVNDAVSGDRKPVDDTSDDCEPVAWRISAWLRRVPIGRSKFYLEREVGRIDTVKCGGATLVTTPPEKYIASLRETDS